MTLNAVIALILRFLRNSTDFQGDFMTVVEDRPIMSVNHCLPVLVFYFWRKLYRTLQRGLSAIAEHLVRLAKVIVKNKMSRFLWFTVYIQMHA